MIHTALEKLNALLASEKQTPIRDGAGVITAAGIDASARIKGIEKCLKIVTDVIKNKDGNL